MHNDAMRIAIAGASGYVGGELIRLLANHPHVTLGALTANSNAGQPLAAVHPHLAALGEHTLVATTPENLQHHDAVILALPHGASAEVAAALDPETLVLDCGADFRLKDPAAWDHYYGGPYAGSWLYGLPELGDTRTLLGGAKRIAVPGCYPTASTLAFAPILAAGLAQSDVTVVAASGTSGAGKVPKAHLTSAEIMGSMSAYGVGGVHRHTPEMIQNLSTAAGLPVTVSFTPLLAPMPRGIIAAVSAPATPEVTADNVHQALRIAYAGEPFVSVLPAEQWPATGATVGANTAQVQATYDPHANRVVAVAVIDNLVKGAAGQAVQCLNIAAGFDETAGLATCGVAP